MAARKPNPKLDLGPDYNLLASDGNGRSWWHRAFDDDGFPLYETDRAKARKFKGPGLASAERALARRGYVTRRVLANVRAKPAPTAQGEAK